jgi:hypothetical protein
VDRDALLASVGLDEERWEVIDAHWQEVLSEELEVEGDDVPPAILRYAEAFLAAQRQAGGHAIDLERFAACACAVRATRDPKAALEKLGVTLTEFLRASQHWTPQLARDPALAARFQRALRDPKSRG